MNRRVGFVQTRYNEIYRFESLRFVGAELHLSVAKGRRRERRARRFPFTHNRHEVPRNVDPTRHLKSMAFSLHNFDDLAAIVKQNMAEREALTKDAEIIIFAALKEFERWQQTLLAAPVIAQLRGKVENIRQSHLRRHPSSKRKPNMLSIVHLNQQLDKISRVLVNEILHKPTTKLKAAKDYQSLRKTIGSAAIAF